MRGTKKKVLSFLLTFAMVSGLMPIMTTPLMAYYEPHPLYIAGQGYDDDSSGTGWSYVYSTNTLTLNNFNYNGTKDAIRYEDSNELNIILEGKNTINGCFYGIVAGVSEHTSQQATPIHISGTGSLTINSEYMGIYTSGRIQIDSGDISVTGSPYGICSEGNSLRINGGTISSTGEYDGINTRTLYMAGGTVKASGQEANGIQVFGFANEEVYVQLDIGTVVAEGNGDHGAGIACYQLDENYNEVPAPVYIYEDSSLTATSHKGKAIFGKVRNDIEGSGWDDPNGTGEGTKIPVSDSGKELSYKKVVFPSSGGSDTPDNPNETVTSSENTRIWGMSGKIDLKSRFSKYGESGYKYKFKVENKAQRKILKVTKKGIGRAKHSGKATVTMLGKKTGGGGAWTKIQDVDFDVEVPVYQKRAQLSVGQTKKMSDYLTNTMSVSPNSYESSKPEVVSIDENGNITAKSAGRAKVYAVYTSGGNTSKFKVSIKVS